MARAVKARQQIAAEQTQQAIVNAAARRFFERGYHATSIGQIAAEAGVAVQTIYNSVGSKRDLLENVLDSAPAGDPAFDGPDPDRILEQLVEFWRAALPRTAPVFRVIREAAAVDPGIEVLERKRRESKDDHLESTSQSLMWERHHAQERVRFGHVQVQRRRKYTVELLTDYEQPAESTAQRRDEESGPALETSSCNQTYEPVDRSDVRGRGNGSHELSRLCDTQVERGG